MSYACLTQQSFQGPPYAIVPIRHEDILLIKRWRNDQIKILRQSHPLTDEEQEQYWSDVIEPSFSEERPNQILFSYLQQGACIGYGGLTRIDWNSKRAEVSFLLETSRNDDLKLFQKELFVFLSWLKKVAFVDLKFNRLLTETFDIRPYLILLLEDFGFRYEGRLRKHARVNGQYVDSLIHGYLREDDSDMGN